MGDFAWKSSENDGKKRDEAEGATNAQRPLDINQTLGGPVMPADGNITTRGDSASEHTQNTWKSIGDIARALAAQAVRK